MNNSLTQHYHRQNLLHTIILLTGMLLLLGLIGWLVAGFLGVLWALGCAVMLLILVSGISSQMVLLLYGAQPLASHQLRQLKDIIDWLSNKSQIQHTPRLYYIPSRAMIAFTVGMQKDPAIAISDGMLQSLNSREIAGVLAHEISHIKNKDLWVMVVADLISRITSIMALSGYIMVIVYLPLSLLTSQNMPWLLLTLLLIAPSLSALMQLALSRTREFNADLQAIKLTSDPQGLMSALNKIENFETHILKQLLMPGLRTPHPSLLRTHPLTKERIERLKTMAQQELHPFLSQHHTNNIQHNTALSRPRNRFTGLWH